MPSKKADTPKTVTLNLQTTSSAISNWANTHFEVISSSTGSEIQNIIVAFAPVHQRLRIVETDKNGKRRFAVIASNMLTHGQGALGTTREFPSNDKPKLYKSLKKAIKGAKRTLRQMHKADLKA